MDHITDYKWEASRGIGFSFGYNQLEGPDAYLSVEELVRSFVDIVSKNGNLLLNVGPMADGTIPEMQRERLLGLGQWLAVNGEAIFGTRPWLTAEGRTVESRDQSGPNDVRFTTTQRRCGPVCDPGRKPSMLEIELDGLMAEEGTTVTLLGQDEPLEWEQWDTALTVILAEALPNAPAHVFKITPQPKATEMLLALSAPEADDAGGRTPLRRADAARAAQPRQQAQGPPRRRGRAGRARETPERDGGLAADQNGDGFHPLPTRRLCAQGVDAGGAGGDWGGSGEIIEQTTRRGRRTMRRTRSRLPSFCPSSRTPTERNRI